MDPELSQLLEKSKRIIASLTEEVYVFVGQRLRQGWIYGAEPLLPIGHGVVTEAVAEAREGGSRPAVAVDSVLTAEIQQHSEVVDIFMEWTTRESISRGAALAPSTAFRQVRSSWSRRCIPPSPCRPAHNPLLWP